MIAIISAIALSAPVSAQGPLTVHNLDTGEDFSHIQAAIYAKNTTAGHTILVDSGTYVQDVNVNKTVIIRGNDTGSGLPVIEGTGVNHPIYIDADNVEIHDFRLLQEYEEAVIWVNSDNNTIDAVTIDMRAQDVCIYLNDGSSGNTISDCTVNNGTYGFALYYAGYNEITDCTISGGSTGIYLSQSKGNVIADCTISGPNQAGISLKGGSSSGNEIRDSTISGAGIYGIILGADVASNSITDCTISGAGSEGIFLLQSDNNVFTRCTVRDTLLGPNSGVHVEESAGNTFVDCSVTENQGTGVYVTDSTDISFERCSVTGNEIGGFSFYSCSGVTLRDCGANDNENGHGIFFRDCYESTIEGCTMSSNSHDGIRVLISDTSTFEGCTMSDNGQFGAFLSSTVNTTLTGCTISNNGEYGARLLRTVNTTLTGCTMNDNTLAGIFILQEDTSVITNTFFRNTLNVDLSENEDDDITWNTTKTSGTNIVYGPYLGGNFWATPDGTGWSQTHPDADGDGIIDEPYVMEVTVGQTTYMYTDYLPLAYVMTADFIADPTSGSASRPFRFTDTSVGEPISWSWDFGDGASSAEQNPAHTYAPGTYTVTLTAENEFANDTVIKTDYITAIDFLKPSGGDDTAEFDFIGTGIILTSSGEGKLLHTTTITSGDGIATLTLPQNTVALDGDGEPVTEITIEKVDASDLPPAPDGATFSFAGFAYECSPAAATFAPPISLAFTLTEDEWEALDGDFSVRFYDERTGRWVEVPVTVDAATHTVTATVSHFSVFALCVEAAEVSTTPASPITLTFTLSAAEWEALDGEDLIVRFYDDATDSWVDVPVTADAASRTITAGVSHFPIFAFNAGAAGETAPETGSMRALDAAAETPGGDEEARPASTTTPESPLVFAPVAALGGMLLLFRRR